MNIKQLSPLRYPGGKAKIIDYIIQLLKDNDCIGSQYVEPYAGGAGVAIGLLINKYVSKIHINDLDKAIYSFWKSILSNTDCFINLINNTEISVEEWRRQKYIYNNQLEFDEIDLGFAAFYLNRCNRSGVLTGGCIGGIHQNGNYSIDARFNKKNLIHRILNIAKHRESIMVYNNDTFDFLKRRHYYFRNYLIYLDPPYYNKGNLLYRNHYKHQDHKKIASILSKINGHWLVSYDNVPEINSLYSSYNKKEFNISYSAGKVKQGKEVMFFSNNLKVPDMAVYS